MNPSETMLAAGGKKMLLLRLVLLVRRENRGEGTVVVVQSGCGVAVAGVYDMVARIGERSKTLGS